MVVYVHLLIHVIPKKLRGNEMAGIFSRLLSTPAARNAAAYAGALGAMKIAADATQDNDNLSVNGRAYGVLAAGALGAGAAVAGVATLAVVSANPAGRKGIGAAAAIAVAANSGPATPGESAVSPVLSSIRAAAAVAVAHNQHTVQS